MTELERAAMLNLSVSDMHYMDAQAGIVCALICVFILFYKTLHY